MVKYLRDGKEYKTKVVPGIKYMLGIYYTATDEPSEVSSISPSGAFAQAGAQRGDIITSINGTEVSTGKELQKYFEANPLDGSVIDIEVKRGKETKTLKVAPHESYTLGFTYNVNGRVEADGIGDVFKYSYVELKYGAQYVFKSLKMLFTGKASVKEVSGPVGIVDLMDETYDETKSEGWLIVFMNLANYLILFSVNLGIFNLIPFPALDGGRLVFLIIEAVRGKPVSREKEGWVNFIGMMILMIFMVYVMYNDITKLF